MKKGCNMNKNLVTNIVEKYLKIFPKEQERLAILKKYLTKNDENEICDWNNVQGHITCGGFVYSQTTQRFLVMWHKDLNMFLYPGGHAEKTDETPLKRAMIEVKEETGLDVKCLKLFDDELIPIDIDTHIIPYNQRVNMPKHYHFDFRYLFVAKNESGVVLDEEEMQSYKWIDKTELSQDPNYGNIIKKLEKYL